jgi:hypothetical protein
MAPSEWSYRHPLASSFAANSRVSSHTQVLIGVRRTWQLWSHLESKQARLSELQIIPEISGCLSNRCLRAQESGLRSMIASRCGFEKWVSRKWWWTNEFRDTLFSDKPIYVGRYGVNGFLLRGGIVGVCCVRWERFPLAPKWILPSCLARTAGQWEQHFEGLELSWSPGYHDSQRPTDRWPKGQAKWSATGRLNVNCISRFKVFWTSKHIIKHHKISTNIIKHLKKTSKTSIKHQNPSYFIVVYSPQHPSIY